MTQVRIEKLILILLLVSCGSQYIFGNQEGELGDVHKDDQNRKSYYKYVGQLRTNLKDRHDDDPVEPEDVYHQKMSTDSTVEGSSQKKNQTIIKMQLQVYQLMKFINTPLSEHEYQELNETFAIEKSAELYQKDAYKSFMFLWKSQKFLSKGIIFSVFNDMHVKQVEVLFDLFFTAKNYTTFYKTALWARYHINEGMFLYTFSVAITHREDTQVLVLPAIYEMYPQYFFNSKVMQKAYEYKMKHDGNHDKNEIYIIPANYSFNPELSLSYFMEDVGISSFYYGYCGFEFPYWMSNRKYELDSRRGDLFYYTHQQLWARFYLELLSHGLGGSNYIDWDAPFEAGYYPSLTYPNGFVFPERPKFANLKEYFLNYGKRWCFVSKCGYGYTYISTYEERIMEAINLEYIYTPDGKKVNLHSIEDFNILANIIEGNADSLNLRYFGTYFNMARHLLGYSKQLQDKNFLVPSALEHFKTSARDPAFYQLIKNVIVLSQKYKTKLPAYTKEDLYFPGVTVKQFEVEPLVTFYDKFVADITNGLTVNPKEYVTEPTIKVEVEQYRLNYRNFNYKIVVNSEKVANASIKLYIGPKYDERGRVIDFNENRLHFVILDYFIHTFQPGDNLIVRNSNDSVIYVKDRTSVSEIYNHGMANTDLFISDDYVVGYPQRLMLPKGTEEGLDFQLYFIVNHFHPENEEIIKYYEAKYNQMKHTKDKYGVADKSTQFLLVAMDSYPQGFPFDHPVESDDVYRVPNAYLADVKIYHKLLQTEYGNALRKMSTKES